MDPDETTSSSSLSTTAISSGLTARTSENGCKTMLPEEFRPTHYSVQCGRGKLCRTSIGNRRLQIIGSMFLQKYSAARNKYEKSIIVSDIISTVKAATNDHGAFIRFHNGRWWEVEELVARERVGSILRDSLHAKYRSSTQSKLARRAIKYGLKCQQNHQDQDKDDSSSDTDESSADSRSRSSIMLGECSNHFFEEFEEDADVLCGEDLLMTNIFEWCTVHNILNLSFPPNTSRISLIDSIVQSRHFSITNWVASRSFDFSDTDSKCSPRWNRASRLPFLLTYSKPFTNANHLL